MSSTEIIVLFLLLLVLFFYFMIQFHPVHQTKANPTYPPLQDPGSALFPVGVLEEPLTGQEPFSGQESVIEGLGITSVSRANAGLPIAQYMIMAAYNATYDGKTHSLDQLTKVLNTGCRFIDLEVSPFRGDPVIQTPQTLANAQSTTKPLLLKDVLSLVVNNCFSTNSLNKADPVFLHFRILITDKAVARGDFYNMIASVLSNELDLLLYKGGKIDASTPFSSLAGKVILVADLSLIPDVGSYPQTCYSGQTCATLTTMLHSVSGSTYWQKMQYDNVSGIPPVIHEANNTIAMPPSQTATTLSMAVPPKTTIPNTTTQNPSPVDLNRFVALSGVQTVPYMWYTKDTGNNEIQFYQALFSNSAAAFVPMAQAIPWIKENYKKQPGAHTANYPNK
jgi:hypothetical protein